MAQPWESDPIVSRAAAAMPWANDPIVTAAKASPWAAPIGGEFGDLSAQPWAQGGKPEDVSPLVGMGQRIGGAMSEAWQGTPNPLMSPELQQMLEGSPYAPVIPLLQGGGMALRGLGAAGAGGMAAVGELAGAAGVPALGRDLNLAAQVAPMATPNALGIPGLPRVRPPGIRTDVDRPYLTPEAASTIEQNRPNALSGGLAPTSETNVPQFVPETPPLPPREPPAAVVPLQVGNRMVDIPAKPAPDATADQIRTAAMNPTVPGSLEHVQAVGADVTREGAGFISPAEREEYARDAEGRRLIEAQPRPDRVPYIPGVDLNTAEIEQTVNNARDLKRYRLQHPEVAQEAQDIADRNAETRKGFWSDLSRTNRDVGDLERSRTERSNETLVDAWDHRGESDPQATIDIANSAMRGASSRVASVRKYIDRAVKELFADDERTQLEHDPMLLHGARMNINELIDDAMRNGNGQAASILLEMKEQLSKDILGGAPRYQRFLDVYTNYSRDIDALKVLQKAEKNLFSGPNNNMTFGSMQRFMKQVVDGRRASGVNPFKSLSDDTMEGLWRLRDDLRRSASAIELARTSGSDTAQNLFDALRGFSKTAGWGAAHGLAALTVGPGVANLGMEAARQFFRPMIDERTRQGEVAKGMSLLRPPAGSIQQNYYSGP